MIGLLFPSKSRALRRFSACWNSCSLAILDLLKIVLAGDFPPAGIRALWRFSAPLKSCSLAIFSPLKIVLAGTRWKFVLFHDLPAFADFVFLAFCIFLL